MTIPAQSGVFGYALQAAKVGRSGTFDPSALTWYKVRAPRVAIGAVQDQQTFPPEIGGVIVPTGAFKQGLFFGGEADLLPRLEDHFGHLLKAAMGAASTVTDTDADGTANVGVNTHSFTFDPASSFTQPWLAVRRLTPGTTAAENAGEIGFDCKLANLRFTIPARGKIATRLAVIGRDVVFDDASTWVWTNTAFEESGSVPDAGRGAFTLNGVEYPLLGAQIDLANNLTNPQQEAIIGDFRPDDLVSLTRAMTIRIVYKYENPNLHRQILTGQAAGTEWSSLPFIQNTGDGGAGVPAFEGRFQAPADIPSATTPIPYELRVVAHRVAWQVDGPLELQAGGIVTQTFMGTVLEPASGNEYAELKLVNGAASY